MLEKAKYKLTLTDLQREELGWKANVECDEWNSGNKRVEFDPWNLFKRLHGKKETFTMAELKWIYEEAQDLYKIAHSNAYFWGDKSELGRVRSMSNLIKKVAKLI